MSRRRRRRLAFPEVEAPAIVREDHIQDRALGAQAGAPRAWRKRSVLELARERGQLDGSEGRSVEARRFQAGQLYTELWLTAQSSGRDSTNTECLSTSPVYVGITESQVQAMRRLAAVETHLGPKDRLLLRLILGENEKLSDGVIRVCGPGYRDRVTARFREALDALIEALETVRRERRRRISGIAALANSE